ncbi:MAG TPA: dihydroneopterin aldolase [Acidimicrobiia bacterium]|nr:dihydroneopterin aldolase [Acidimicrobiia bacterium]
MDTIAITGIRAMGVHGALEEEQQRPQPFEIDVELEVDLRNPGETDRLEDTVDYAAVAEAAVRVVESERHHLLERLATRIAEMCTSDDRVATATITVRKLHPPVRALLEHVSVTVRR